jgi:hypothetical protein
MRTNSNQQLATLILGYAVATFVNTRRAKGASWRIVARELYEATSGQVDVTPQTLRNWTP